MRKRGVKVGPIWGMAREEGVAIWPIWGRVGEEGVEIGPIYWVGLGRGEVEKQALWRVSGAEQTHSLSKARVKQDRAWSPNAWVTVAC